PVRLRFVPPGLGTARAIRLESKPQFRQQRRPSNWHTRSDCGAKPFNRFLSELRRSANLPNIISPSNASTKSGRPRKKLSRKPKLGLFLADVCRPYLASGY